jgi:hypothetical protein
MATIAPIISVPSPWPQQPEVAHPENFYTYRRPFVDPDAVKHVWRDWPNLAPTDFNPPQGAAGPQAIAALRKWVEGNQSFDKRRYAAAIAAYDACQDAVIGYFTRFYPTDIAVPAGSRVEQLLALFSALLRSATSVGTLGVASRAVRVAVLAELEAHDTIHARRRMRQREELHLAPDGQSELSARPHQRLPRRNLDAPLMTLALVLVRMARRGKPVAPPMRRRSVTYRNGFALPVRLVGTPTTGGMAPQPVHVHLACDFIEMPFARLLIAETLLDRSRHRCQAHVPADPPPAQDVAQFQNLKAAQTYQQLVDLLRVRANA